MITRSVARRRSVKPPPPFEPDTTETRWHCLNKAASIPTSESAPRGREFVHAVNNAQLSAWLSLIMPTYDLLQ